MGSLFNYILWGGGMLLAAVVTALLIPPLRHLAIRNKWTDEPDGVRKLHTVPTPPVGGLAIALGFFSGLVFLLIAWDDLPVLLNQQTLTLILGAVLMIGVGLYDDIRSIGFKGKFAVELVAAFILLNGGYCIDVSGLPFIEADPYYHNLYGIPLTLLWVIGVINAVNLIDGLDGLAGGVVAIGFACLALIFGLQGETYLVILALLMTGAIAGFLFFNFAPASVFMGDTGSLFLGYMLAAYSLQGQLHADPLLSLLVPVAAIGLPLFDTSFSIIRRYASGRAIFAPDQDHIHHRLLRFFPQRKVVLILYALSTGFGAVAVTMAVSSRGLALGLFTITLVACCLGIRLLGYRRDRKPTTQRALLDRDVHHVHTSEEKHYVDAPSEQLALEVT